jgi:hypothetical protein
VSRSSRPPLLEDVIALLVQHFGASRVWAAMDKVTIGDDSRSERPVRASTHRSATPRRPTVAQALELCRGRDPEKHRLLGEFYTSLKNRRVLPDAQDIRHFAQRVGLKDIGGKSRRDMVPTLMCFLLEQPTEWLRGQVESATNISEQQRGRGFSVLTDKLLGDIGA